MFEGTINVSGREIPKTLLGSSPFIAAPQFGHRARLYQLDLYSKPENITKIIEKSVGMGVSGIQVIPYDPVIEALQLAEDIGIKMEIVGTVRPETLDNDIELLSELEAAAMMLHGAITDDKDWDLIEEKLLLVKDHGSIPGLVTHMPFETTASLLESNVVDLFDIYSIPVNKLGYLMDCDVYGEEVRIKLSRMMAQLNKTVIVKKVLAAGILRPKEAFNYLKTVDFADIVTLGIASEDEAQETFGLLSSI